MNAQVNGIKMAYDIAGQGTPVLWIHGYPLSRATWRRQVSELSSVGRHIAPDLRGYGESDAPDGVYTMELLADDMCALLDAVNVKRAVVAGLSMGGYVALAFALKYPDRIAGLILSNTRAGADSPEAAKARNDNADRALREGVKPVVEPMLGKLFSARTVEQKPSLVDELRAILLSASPNGVAGALRGMAVRPDVTPRLASITAPALIVTSSDDAVIPPAESQKMAAAIKGATLVEIPGAGHLPNMEQPTAFNKAVSECLRTIR